MKIDTNSIKANAYEYPDGQNFFCIVWDKDISKEFIISKNEAEEFFPNMKIRRAIKLIAIERFKDEA